MKPSLFVPALVLGTLANGALAQSNLTLYGLMDAGMVHESGGAAGSSTKLSSGVGTASRLGFKGQEDLGGGVSAVFTLESGILIDTGAQDAAGKAFNRQAFVGLESKTLGSITVGRQYTPTYNALGQVGDPFGSGYSGSAKNLFPVAGRNLRADNSILYTSPNWNGFNANVLYSLGEVSGNSKAERQINLSLNYSGGPLNARLTYNNRNNDTASVENPSGRNIMLVANYDFRIVRMYFAYSDDEGLNSAPLNNSTPRPYGRDFQPSLKGNDMLVGASIPVGAAGTVMTSYIRKNDKTLLNQDASQYAVGYLHKLSKRTGVYASYGRIINKNGAGYTVGNNSNAGTGDKAYNLGIRHAF